MPPSLTSSVFWNASKYPLIVDLLKEVRKSKIKDDEVIKVVEEMKQAGVKMLRDEE